MATERQPRAVLYCRVSTDAQERDGTSLDTQERACVEYATAAGWPIVETVRDAASGYSLDRPGMERVRRMLRDGEAEVIVAYAVDRLSRNQNQIGVLFDEAQSAGARLEFVTEKFEDTAIGRFILAARAFIAEVEREKIAERTMRGKAERARSGKIPQGTGAGIYGYTYDPATGRRTPEPEQAAAVGRIFERFCAGASVAGIAQSLTAEGITAFGGGRWHPLTVRRLLDNETYTGRTIYRRTRVDAVRDPRSGRKRRRVTTRDASEWIEVPGATPALISAETYRAAQAILADPARRLRGAPTHTYRLRGRLRCLACGTPMVGQSLMHGRYHYYRCRKAYSREGVKCASRYVAVETVEAAVREALAGLLAQPERVLAEARRLAGVRPGSERLEAVTAELAEVETQQRRLVRLYTAGTLPEAMLAEENTRLSARRAALDAEQRTLRPEASPPIDVEQIAAALPQVLSRIRAWVAADDGGAGDGDHLALLLDVLAVSITASHEWVEISGSLPASSEGEQWYNRLVTTARTSASPHGRSRRCRPGE